MANKLALAQVIKALRSELEQAKQAAAGETIRFNVDNIEVELETAVELEGDLEAGGKIKFWVLDMDAKASGAYTKATTHRIKLGLKVTDDGGGLQLSGDE